MKYKLDNEEQEILNAYENGQLEEVSNMAELLAISKAAAKQTIENFEKINIEIRTNDLYRLQVKSLETGVSYQNIISALIHNYVNNRISVTL